MLQTLARLEETSLSIWLRESGPAFFSALTLHSLSMAMVVGINIALALRLLGWVPAFDIKPLREYFPLYWAAAGLILLSGLALLLAYPAKALSNPLFYLKLLALGLAMLISRRLETGLLNSGQQPSRPALAAALMLGLWVVVIFAGRFLAYTYSILLASRFY